MDEEEPGDGDDDMVRVGDDDYIDDDIMSMGGGCRHGNCYWLAD